MLSKVLFFLISEIIVIYLFWSNTLLVVTLLIFLLILKHKIIPIKKEYLWFVIAGFVGAFGESFMMLRGPWSYASPHILNFPIWLFFAWGLAGCIGVSLYKAIENIS